MLAMLGVTVLAVLFGYLLGGPATSYRRTLAIGTGLRNVGLASVVATGNFADTIVPAAVLTYLLVQFVVCTLVGVYFTRAAKASSSALEASA
jgi:predicted Na+-dependent transporter